MDTTISAFFIYKTIALIIGAITIFLGYRLFMKGIVNSAGDLSTESANIKLSLQKAAPGTFFALFGALIIGVKIFKNPNIKTTSKHGNDIEELDLKKAEGDTSIQWEKDSIDIDSVQKANTHKNK